MSIEILNFNLNNNNNTKSKKLNFLKVKTNRIYLPWVEKYRPSVLSDVILDDITRHKMETFLLNDEMSNMIITGPPGTGKTSTILMFS